MPTELEELKAKSFKSRVLKGVIIFFTLTLILRLFYLQIFNYKTLSERAQYSTSKISILTAPRGIIFDRTGKILATNKQAISVVVYPNKLKTQEERLEVYFQLVKILKTEPIKLKETFLKLPKEAPLPIRLESNVSVEEATQIVEKQHLLNGISIQKEPIRFYPNLSLASHVLGYISQINEDELLQRSDRKIGDLVGKDGVEKLYDGILRGVDGKDIVEIDRLGKPIDPAYKHGVIHTDPIPGKNVYLTLDLNIQKACEDALQESNTNSACVVVNPNTGEILALASYPTFDPNIFTKPLSNSTWRGLLAKKAFLNRAILAYTPGSIWKPITLIAALEEKVVDPKERFNVSDAYYLGSVRFGDWTDKKGNLSLEEALAWSRDTAFYQIGKRVGPAKITNWAIKLGAGVKTGIELLGEEVGIVPDEAWKKKNIGEPWFPGNTLHYSIGQGFVLVTPVQVGRIFSTLATGGKVPKLHLVQSVVNQITTVPLNKTNQLNLNRDFLNVVKKGLELCVDIGTGVASRLNNVKVAGKTGSAEVFSTSKTHGWFAAYAPAENPEIVVVVLAEKAGHGGSISAPIAKKVFEAYFKLKDEKTSQAVASSTNHL